MDIHAIIKIAMLRGMGRAVGTFSQKLDEGVKDVIADLKSAGLLNEDNATVAQKKSHTLPT